MKEGRWNPQHMEDRRANPRVPVADGHRSTDTISRKTFVLGGLVIGAVIAIVISGLVFFALEFTHFQTDQVVRNKEAIDRLDRIARDLHPSDAQFRAQILLAIQRCKLDPDCREALRTLFSTR